MDKATLDRAVEAFRTETRDALQTVFDALNKGQQDKLMRNEAVKALLERYEIS